MLDFKVIVYFLSNLIGFFCNYRTSTPLELELTYFHAATFYISMTHYCLYTINVGLENWTGLILLL